VISDVMMPGLDGFGLLKKVRKHPELKNTPVIFLSARAGEESKVEGLDAGADDYLVKPFSAKELIVRVTNHINLKKIRREIELNLEKLVAERTLELQRSNEDLQQFAHVASHDLKEPVRKIKTFSSRLQSEFGHDLPAKGKMYIDKIQGATNRMYDMIEGVLKYSTLNEEQLPVELVDLNAVLQNIEADFELVIHQKHAVIHKGELPPIEGAPVLIYQLFYNLINNSLKFSRPEVAPVINITSSVESENGRAKAKITIADNGIGFDQEHADRIFDTFTRLNSKDKYEGTGLGLALCKKIVEKHKGTIYASGSENEGAAFTILIPLIQTNKKV
jgi:light-regulated signal transduction histidine kinase (bacteriophytochrome)